MHVRSAPESEQTMSPVVYQKNKAVFINFSHFHCNRDFGSFQLNMLKKLTVRVDWKVHPSRSYSTLTCIASWPAVKHVPLCAVLISKELKCGSWFPPKGELWDQIRGYVLGIISCIVHLTSIPVCLEESGGGSWVLWKLFWRDWGLAKKLTWASHRQPNSKRHMWVNTGASNIKQATVWPREVQYNFFY